MAYLPYTDGSNGNGITDVYELLQYLEQYPIAWMDHGFIGSYEPLLNSYAAKLEEKVERKKRTKGIKTGKEVDKTSKTRK